MKPIIVNEEAVINKGPLKGTAGKVVAFDNKEDEVTIQVDKNSFAHLSSDYIYQPKWNSKGKADESEQEDV